MTATEFDRALISSKSSAPAAKSRDMRLDFFRGASLLIIFMAHVHGNIMWWCIPARFGLSDAADTFVFCSGFASGLAFYKLFQTHGLALGAARIGYRIWQVYWAHVLLTVTALGFCLAASSIFTEQDFLARWGLRYFADNLDTTVSGLLTLYVQPGRSDILPMYIVMLAAMPLVVALTRAHRYLAVAVCLAIYMAVQFTDMNFPRAGGVWFFNPFAWQILFFGGFFLATGILPAPRPHVILTIAAITFVALSVLISHPSLLRAYPELRELRGDLIPGDHKTNMHFLRALHFYCLAYLFGVAWRGLDALLRGAWAAPFVFVGQHALAIFAAGIMMSILGDVVLTQWGGHAASWFVVNVGGVALLFLIAFLVRSIRRLDRRSPELPA